MEREIGGREPRSEREGNKKGAQEGDTRRRRKDSFG